MKGSLSLLSGMSVTWISAIDWLFNDLSFVLNHQAVESRCRAFTSTGNCSPGSLIITFWRVALSRVKSSKNSLFPNFCRWDPHACSSLCTPGIVKWTPSRIRYWFARSSYIQQLWEQKHRFRETYQIQVMRCEFYTKPNSPLPFPPGLPIRTV